MASHSPLTAAPIRTVAVVIGIELLAVCRWGTGVRGPG
jgi:hypothetical protein